MPRVENEDREERILNAAVKLITHYGYDKTTIDEIAREAGISKGAVYLHFESKESLFEALFFREMQLYAEKWMQGIEADPNGGTIGGMYKNMLVALSARPFMAAVFKQDRRVLGNYMRRSDNLFKGKQFKGTREIFIKQLQDLGGVRQDLDPKITAHIMNMLAYGLVAMDEIMDVDEIPPTDAVIEGIADFMDRALSPQDGGNREAAKELLRQTVSVGKQTVQEIKVQQEKEK